MGSGVAACGARMTTRSLTPSRIGTIASLLAYPVSATRCASVDEGRAACVAAMANRTNERCMIPRPRLPDLRPQAVGAHHRISRLAVERPSELGQVGQRPHDPPPGGRVGIDGHLVPQVLV